jgi:hypothetical protein
LLRHEPSAIFPSVKAESAADDFSNSAIAWQPEELYEHLSCPKTLMRFSAAEGAGAHCHVGVHRLAFGRIYDWLDDTLER